MRHNDIITTPTLCPQEAVRLGKMRTVNDIHIAEEIYEAYDIKNHQIRDTEPYWYTFCLLAACWNAGRIEGVRMERARRKAKEDS